MQTRQCLFYAANLVRAIGLLVALGCWQSAVIAQPVENPFGFEGRVLVDGEMMEMHVSPDGVTQVQPSGEQPVTEGEDTSESEQEGEENKEEGKDEESKEGEAKDTIARPDKPPRVPDPREFDAKPDEHGRIQFSFNGQTWPGVLQWLATVSDCSLDWQELPNDYINLSTQGSHSIDEARDLINSLLHARGFTLIVNGKVMKVFKIEKLDPSLIPRVTEEDLYDLQPHDFVKVTFQLPDEMEVAATSEDVKKALSKHAQVIPLPATKRLLVIDAIANLRLVSLILNEERLVADGKIIPTEIILKHRRAEKIIDILYVILGLDPASRPSQEELAVQQQKMQLLMQMQGAGKDVASMLQKGGPPVYIAFNSQRNSILVNAPPRELKIIRRTVEMLDVPANHASEEDLVADSGLRVPRSYKLESISPDALQRTLEEIGDLSPLTELRADRRADILFARATATDHEKIAKLIEELDGAKLETIVIELHKHDADAVAGTLQGLFTEKKEENNSYRRRWDWWDYERRNEEEQTELRVDADVENNRLIVRGTPEQLVQVRDFLTKIGETPSGGIASASRLRVIDALDPEATARLIEQLRRTWPRVSDNELVIEGPEPPANDVPEEEASEREPRANATPTSPFRLAGETQPPAAQPLPSEGREPVVIKIAPDGRLLLSSRDTAALDKLEELIESSAEPPKRFKIIQIRYVTAYSIYFTLKTFYREELRTERSGGYYDYRWDRWVDPNADKRGAQLSKRKKLQLDWDTPSNTIFVANASASQLREIQELIAAYDKPSAVKTANVRRTAAIKIKYSRAKVVAAALKEVYRDLLSTRDKEFETEEKKGTGFALKKTTIMRFGESTGEEEREPMPVKVGFQGALSIGIDEISNTLIISVQEELFESVLLIVKSLDEAARPNTTVAVHSVQSGVSPEAIHKALAEALGETWVGGKPEKMGQQQEGEKKEEGNQEVEAKERNNGNREYRRSRRGRPEIQFFGSQ